MTQPAVLCTLPCRWATALQNRMEPFHTLQRSCTTSSHLLLSKQRRSSLSHKAEIRTWSWGSHSCVGIWIEKFCLRLTPRLWNHFVRRKHRCASFLARVAWHGTWCWHSAGKVTAWPLIFKVVPCSLRVASSIGGLICTFVTAVEVAGYLREQ